jgi:CoA-dependent NAD(P)H sulfur oxidoreductase
MARVVVIGGGAAGVAASVEASRLGAEVVLLEASDRLPPNRSLLPYLLSGRLSPQEVVTTDSDELPRSFGIHVELEHGVKRIDLAARSVQSARPGRNRIRYDALVIATGSSYLPEERKGISKKEVFVLKSPEDYLSLRSSIPKLSRVAVTAPSAPLALVIAQELSTAVKVTLFLSAGTLERFSPRIGGLMKAAATACGIEVVYSDAKAIVGMKHVEGVIAQGVVHPCDAVAVIPRSVASLPEIDLQMGRYGGAIVDASMRTSSKGIFAAGDCAEVRLGSGSLPFRLHSSALVMGRTAGRNAVGGAPVEAGLSGSVSFAVFGTELTMAGIGVSEGRAIGLDLMEMEDEGESLTGASSGDRALCLSMTFEKETHRVYGIQAAGKGALALSSYLTTAVSSHLRLEDLAYQESPYVPPIDTGTFPICLTAGRFITRLRG